MTALDALACELVRLLAVVTDGSDGVSVREAADRTWAASIQTFRMLDAHGLAAMRSIRFGVVVSRYSIIAAMISCGAAMCRAAALDSEPPITQREPDDVASETP